MLKIMADILGKFKFQYMGTAFNYSEAKTYMQELHTVSTTDAQCIQYVPLG